MRDRKKGIELILPNSQSKTMKENKEHKNYVKNLH